MVVSGPEREQPGVIIGIHGLANKPPVAEKTRWWQAAIREGLSRNEGITEAAFAFAFAYWADLRYDAPLQGDGIHDPYRPLEGSGPLPSGNEAPAATGRDFLAGLYAGIDRIQAMTGLTPVDDTILEYRFDDLWHYNVTRAFAQSVRARLVARLTEFRRHRILLVAHSMGAVIAYDTLRILERDDPTLRVADFVTVGAPLGLAKVTLKVAAECGPVRVPNNVGRWTNLADSNDVVTLTGALAADYGPSDGGVCVDDQRVVNGYRRPDGVANHHKSYGYLRTPEFSRIARGFLDPVGALVPERFDAGDLARTAPLGGSEG